MGQKRRPVFGAIEGGGTKFVCGVGFEHGEFLAIETVPTANPDITAAKIRAFFDDQIGQHGPLRAIGVGSFGPVDIDPASSSYGSILSTPKPSWSGFSYPDVLSQYDCPLVVNTDVDAAALGEFEVAGCRGKGPLAHVTVGTGIGVGLANADGILGGASHYEFGHVRVPRHMADRDFAGICPFHADCLEGLVCGPAIQARWGARLDQLPDQIGAKEIVADYLAHLANIITLTHMPRRIVVGGGVSQTEGLLPLVRARLSTLMGGYLDAAHISGDLTTYIVRPKLGGLSGLKGARRLAVEAVSLPGSCE